MNDVLRGVQIDSASLRFQAGCRQEAGAPVASVALRLKAAAAGRSDSERL